MIERLSEAMGTTLIGNNFWLIPSKISFHMKKKVTRRGPISTKHLNLFDSQTESVSQEW